MYCKAALKRLLSFRSALRIFRLFMLPGITLSSLLIIFIFFF